jgi:hypothetical protein
MEKPTVNRQSGSAVGHHSIAAQREIMPRASQSSSGFQAGCPEKLPDARGKRVTIRPIPKQARQHSAARAVPVPGRIALSPCETTWKRVLLVWVTFLLYATQARLSTQKFPIDNRAELLYNVHVNTFT